MWPLVWHIFYYYFVLTAPNCSQRQWQRQRQPATGAAVTRNNFWQANAARLIATVFQTINTCYNEFCTRSQLVLMYSSRAPFAYYRAHLPLLWYFWLFLVCSEATFSNQFMVIAICNRASMVQWCRERAMRNHAGEMHILNSSLLFNFWDLVTHIFF